MLAETKREVAKAIKKLGIYKLFKSLSVNITIQVLMKIVKRPRVMMFTGKVNNRINGRINKLTTPRIIPAHSAVSGVLNIMVGKINGMQ